MQLFCFIVKIFKNRGDDTLNLMIIYSLCISYDL